VAQTIGFRRLRFLKERQATEPDGLSHRLSYTFTPEIFTSASNNCIRVTDAG